VAFPDFNEHGDLPPTVYRSSLREAIQHFGASSPRREIVAMRLERIYEMARESGHLKRFAVFGSFVTAKEDPNDVDIFMIMDDGFDVTKVDPANAVLFEHAAAQSHLGASVFWVRSMAAMGGEQAAIEDWMLTREGRNRGILEISK
jgi:predicted nucleotidyltransferase